MIILQRVYDWKEKHKGNAVLVDRLWPRGISKSDLPVLWEKELAPSHELRKWFAHDQDKWELFKEKYKEELEHKHELLGNIIHLERTHKTITLLYSARKEKYNQAVVLKEVLEELREKITR